MNNQLSSIAVQYRKFSKGQYIGPDQFNEFLDYFEDQDRLSRMLLQGVGIVCGFKPTLIYKDRLLNSIQLSQGVAVTTDGDLLTLNKTKKVSEELYMSDLKTVDVKNKEFTHFKTYDNFRVKYPSFYEGTEQIEVWELATAEEAKTDFQPITKLSGLEDKYLLLYLEDYEKEMKPCVGIDCDNHGFLQVRNLKVLVTTAKGITHILGDDRLVIDPITGTKKRSRKDRIQPHPLFIDGILGTDEPQRVIMSRLIAANGADTRFSSSHIKNMYIDVLAKNKYGQAVFEKIQAIAGILGVPTVNYQPFRESLARVINQEIGYQYAYDVVKDLMDTYSEIIKLLPKAFTKCLPDFASFPKHIMLGKLISDTQLDSFRHQFYNSPVLDDDKATQKVKFLISRFNHQVGYFDADRIMNNKGRVKIIQSRKLSPLSNKAIPFYYSVTEGFLKVWNFEKTGNRSHQDNLAYDTNWQSSNPGAQDDPLVFNIDRNSFYNIEGHQGMDYQKALEQIKQIRDKQQLGFDIVALSLEELVHNKDFSKAYFNEYVEQNPGMEHRHGVEKGGTFLIVYDSIRNPNVIADFSLPYICCTPKSIVKLSLPSAVVCNKSGRIPFTVFPMNGVVEANVDAKFNGGVEIINGLYFFNPELVSPELYGQEITFTVNGKATECSIKVIPQPDIKITVGPVFYPEGASPATIVNFTVSGQNFADYTYSWDFWDNGSFTTSKPDKDGNVSYTYYNLSPTKIPAIKVKVSGSGCTQDVIIRDWYNAPAKLTLPVEIICSGDDAIRFTEVIPAGGPIVAYFGTTPIDNQDKVIGSNLNGDFYFNPGAVNANLHGQYITFTVNGQPTNCRIKVVPPPKVSLNYTVDYATNGSTNATINIGISGGYSEHYFYEWDFDGSGQYSQPELIVNGKISHNYTNLNLNNIPVIKAIVSGGVCKQEIVIRDWYDVPVSLSLPSKVICSRAGSIPFTVFPLSGEVKAQAGAEASVSLSNGVYSFNPGAVGSNLYGQDIAFTVGTKPTNCRIKVVPPPTVSTSYTVDYPANGSTDTIITINVSGPYFNEYTYGWDFTGTGQYTVMPLENGKIIHRYTNLDPKKIPVIGIEVKADGCTQKIPISEWYRPTYVMIDKISFPPTGNCCNTVLRTLSADAGRNQDFILSKGELPTRQLGIKGSAGGATYYLYFWSKLLGPDVILENVNGHTLNIKDIRVGKYIFQLLVKDVESDAFAIARVDINVAP